MYAAKSMDHFGAVDVLCNNAGVVPSGRYRPIWEFPLEDWKWSFDVNLMGLVHGIRSFIPRMIAQGTDGHVVTTASVAGVVSGAGSPVYSAAKTAAVRATEALYASLKDINSPIGVTLLCPGLVNTNIYRSERNRPSELQPAAGVAEETAELKAIADNLYRSAISPEAVAEMVFDAMEKRQFYLLTSDKFDHSIKLRSDALLSRTNPNFESLLELSKGDVDEEEVA
jgi:NAD(P)-dependent dehydrogenase (short-subunit alcohol dehydrogenase family)